MNRFLFFAGLIASVSIATYCYGTVPDVNLCWDPNFGGPGIGGSANAWVRPGMACDNKTACGSTMLCGQVATNCPGGQPRAFRQIELAGISAVGECVPYNTSCFHCGPPSHGPLVGIVCLHMKAYTSRVQNTNVCFGPCDYYVYESRAGCIKNP